MAHPQSSPHDTTGRAHQLHAAAASASARAEERRILATAAQSRADDAHRRATAARDAADRATTEYARDSHLRVADLYAGLALCHQDEANSLRPLREGPNRR